MRLKISKSKNAASLYVIKDITVNNKRTTKIVEKLGTVKELESKLNGNDPIEWAKSYIDMLNKKEKKQTRDVIVKYSQSKLISKNVQRSFNGGYLFLQQIYHQLGMHKICKTISDNYKFSYNLDSILSRLIYGRILFPSSKLNTYQESKKLLEQPEFELHHVYRALEVIAKETDFIQSEVYKNSLSISKRNDQILYYDCTNYFFEIEEADGLKQYGVSKENRPNPLIEMGLFMDGDGIPLAFNIHSGNTNEQTTLKPLEEKILKDFELARFVVCTDAGLSSTSNRKFNNKQGRSFITTQSIKKLKGHLKEWAIDPSGWHLTGRKGSYNISTLEEDEKAYEKYKSETFYKERWINENGLEQKLIVTYSLKYRDYQRQIRSKQVEQNPTSINTDAVKKVEMYDGFYAVCTNLEDEASTIIKINQKRWKIEECFRILKYDFKSRPVYLSRDDRITAHFTTCFLALTVYRYLKKRLNERFTCDEIISNLKDLNFKYVPHSGYIPTYTRNDFTDALHESFEFRTDHEIVSEKKMKKIFKDTKK